MGPDQGAHPQNLDGPQARVLRGGAAFQVKQSEEAPNLLPIGTPTFDLKILNNFTVSSLPFPNMMLSTGYPKWYAKRSDNFREICD